MVILVIRRCQADRQLRTLKGARTIVALSENARKQPITGPGRSSVPTSSEPSLGRDGMYRASNALQRLALEPKARIPPCDILTLQATPGQSRSDWDPESTLMSFANIRDWSSRRPSTG